MTGVQTCALPIYPKAPMDVVKTRTVERTVVKWAKISGKDVLEIGRASCRERV